MTPRTEVRPGVYSYDVAWDYEKPLGVHVIETDLATVLFGAGTEDTTGSVVEIALEHDVDVVVAEHGDIDHYGGIPALREAIDGVTVAAPAGDSSFLEAANIDVNYELEPNKAYWGVETIPTPGHTPDHMCYLYEDVLIAGDAVVGTDSTFPAAGEWSGPFAVITSEYNDDDDRTRDSVSVLADYDFEVVLLSHGENAIENGTEKIETLIEDLK